MKAKYKKWIKWGGIALGAVAIVGAIVGITSAITASNEDTRVLTATDYALYALDDTTGIADTSSQCNVSTKGFYLLEGLECDLAKNATISYQVNYYDEDKQFIDCADYEEDYDGAEIEEWKLQGAVYVRIEIIPKGDSDGLVSAFEKNGYVEQLKVTITKEDKK